MSMDRVNSGNIFNMARNTYDREKEEKKKFNNVTNEFFDALSKSVTDYFVRQSEFDPNLKIEEETQLLFDKLSVFVADYFEQNPEIKPENITKDSQTFFASIINYVESYFKENFGEYSRRQYAYSAKNFLSGFVPSISAYFDENMDTLTGKTNEQILNTSFMMYNFSQAMKDAESDVGNKFEVNM